MKATPLFLAATLLATLLSCTPKAKYDLSPYSHTALYYGGDIITVDDTLPAVEAVLVGDGRIIATGTKRGLMRSRTETTTLIDLQGRTMLPGFIDSHSHIHMVGKYPDFTPANDVTSIDALVEHGRKEFQAWYDRSVADGTYEEGDWFVGVGYDNTAFPQAANPTADDLDRISTDVPVCIIHSSNHIGVVNHKGLELMGYTPGSTLTRQQDKWIGKTADGLPNGLLEEEAFFRIYFAPNVMMDNDVTNSGTPEEVLQRAMHTYASYGITTAQDGAGSDIAETVARIVAAGGALPIDINCYTDRHHIDTPSREAQYVNGLRVAGVKIYLDGSPQAKTAWLNEPYYIVPSGKAPDYRGYPQMTDSALLAELSACLTAGYQVYAHTNGNAAIEQFLTQYERAKAATGVTTDLRPVLIHAQTITEAQLDRAETVGVDVSFFHDHTYYWGDYHLTSVLGPERGARISPLASALRRPSVNVTMHQDSPVVPPDMLFSIHNAVNRTTRDGRPIGREYAVSPLTAIRLLTLNGAYQYFQENDRGSITPGKVADFVILDRNPLTVEPSTIKDIRVVQTIKRGEVIYNNNNKD